MHYLLNRTDIGQYSVLLLNVRKYCRGHLHAFHFQRSFAGKCDFRSNVRNGNIAGGMATISSFSVQQWFHECA